jgi:superfamily I DNA/RNA helicase
MTVPVHKHIIGQKKPGYYKWIASMKEYKLPVKGKVYMLGRTKYNLEPFIEWCKSHGVMYQLACTEWPVLNSMEYIMAQKGTEKKDLLDQPEKTYFIHVGKETGNLFNTLGRVYIGTIHSVKGGEADHVLLSTDTSKATSEAYRMDPDGEHRVFYTAMSRAKIGVTLLMPSTPYAYLDLERIEKHGEGD